MAAQTAIQEQERRAPDGAFVRNSDSRNVGETKLGGKSPGMTDLSALKCGRPRNYEDDA
jgi:hypothetical protein